MLPSFGYNFSLRWKKNLSNYLSIYASQSIPSLNMEIFNYYFNLIPRIGILKERLSPSVGIEGPIFCEKATQRTATRPAVEPQNDGNRIVVLVLVLGEPVGVHQDYCISGYCNFILRLRYHKSTPS